MMTRPLLLGASVLVAPVGVTTDTGLEPTGRTSTPPVGELKPMPALVGALASVHAPVDCGAPSELVLLTMRHTPPFVAGASQACPPGTLPINRLCPDWNGEVAGSGATADGGSA